MGELRRAAGATVGRCVALIAGTLAVTIPANTATPNGRAHVQPRATADRLEAPISAARFGVLGELAELVRQTINGTPEADEGSAAQAQGDDWFQFGQSRVPRRLAMDILRAAQTTSVDPVYLMALADKESSFRPSVQAQTSSAAGLYQFIERTWFEVVREFGPRHGLAEEARLVRNDADGRPTIEDAEARARVLELRNDPYLSAVMAAEMHKRDQARISRNIERPLAPTDWYIAHFFGPNDAARFLRSHGERPAMAASRLFPAAARANRALFTRPNGRRRAPVTVAELYQRLDRAIDQRLNRFGNVEAMANWDASANTN
jgi:hypothetical protein